MKFAGFGFVAIGLAGCGGGGTESSELPRFASFAELGEFTAGVTDRTDALAVTSVAQVPTTGVAQYTGVFTLLVNEPGIVDGVVGTTVIDVSFSSDRVMGEAGNFFTLDEAPASGEIRLVDGQISRGSAVSIQAELVGDVSLEGGDRRIDGTFVGAFLGPSVEALAGVVAAEGMATGEADIAMVGALVAEQ